MEYHSLSEQWIIAIHDAMAIIRKLYPGHAMRYNPFRDPENGEWVEGNLEIAGITMEDCGHIQELLWQDVNRRGDIHIVTEPWYDWENNLPGQKG